MYQEEEKTVLKHVPRVNFYIKDFHGIRFIGDKSLFNKEEEKLTEFQDRFLYSRIRYRRRDDEYSMTFSQETEFIPRIGELIELDNSIRGGVKQNTVLFGENPKILEIFPKLKGETKNSKEYKNRLCEAIKKFTPQLAKDLKPNSITDFEKFIHYFLWPMDRLRFRVVDIKHILNPLRGRIDTCVYLELEQPKE